MNINLSKYEQAELDYCDRYGILNSKRKGSKMTYWEYFPTSTYYVTVCLKTQKEIARRQTKGAR